MWNFLQKKPPNEAEVWSRSPGCFEKHLLRRLGNPLFPPSKRTVTKKEFRDARALDERDAAAFKHIFADHMREGGRLHGPETLSYVRDYLKRSLELMERASAIGGDLEEEMRTLEAAIGACKDLLYSNSGPESAAVLERAMNLHGLEIGNSFLAQSSRPDSPIPKDIEGWVRALLSEDDATIKHTAVYSGGLGIKILDHARAILAAAVRDGLPVIDARRKLGGLEEGYARGIASVSASGRG